MAAIEKLLKALDNDECNRLIGKTNLEYSELISPAVIEWQTMLFTGLKLSSEIRTKVDESELLSLLASSMIVLGTIMQYGHALGIQRGNRERRQKRQKK